MALFRARQVDAQVVTVAWSRVVQLERQEWIAKRGASSPGEARNVEKHSETYWATVTDTKPGAPGMNGIPGPSVSTVRSELRTRVYYTYEVQEWRKGRTLSAEGADQGDVKWPDSPLEPEERVRSRQETYSATFAAAGKQYEATLPERDWRAVIPGGSCRLVLGLLGGVKKVAPL
jgi:hypothetical protein